MLLLLAATACAGTPVEEFDAAAFYESNCMRCHAGATGGDIGSLPPVHNANGHTWHHGDCLLAETIRDGAPRRPGLPADVPTMPPFSQLDSEQVDALIDHMQTWWTPEQLAEQVQSTAAACS
jgi:mono/diheme cytochrome c family protein